jgi:hypothetical protein
MYIFCRSAVYGRTLDLAGSYHLLIVSVNFVMSHCELWGTTSTVSTPSKMRADLGALEALVASASYIENSLLVRLCESTKTLPYDVNVVNDRLNSFLASCGDLKWKGDMHDVGTSGILARNNVSINEKHVEQLYESKFLDSISLLDERLFLNVDLSAKIGTPSKATKYNSKPNTPQRSSRVLFQGGANSPVAGPHSRIINLSPFNNKLPG